MTLQVGPVPHKADNNAGLQKPLSANGPRCADTIMMARPQQHNERHKEAGYTTATIPPRLELLFVSTCGRSPYTHC
jgi:hypothetical protein